MKFNSPCFAWLAPPPGRRLVLTPQADDGLRTLGETLDEACLLIGSEGGLSALEIQAAQEHAFRAVRLGPRRCAPTPPRSAP